MPTHLNKIQVLVTPEQHRIIKEAAKANLRSMGGELAYRAFAASTKRVSAATDGYEKTEATHADSDDYSDKVTLTGNIQWVVAGPSMAEAKKGGA